MSNKIFYQCDMDKYPDTSDNRDDYSCLQELDKHIDKAMEQFTPIEAEAFRLHTEPDLKRFLTLGFDERGMLMIRRRAYIRLLWEYNSKTKC